MSLKLRRLIQIIIGVAAVLISANIVSAAVQSWSRTGAAGLLPALVPLLFALLPIGIFEWQNRSIAKAGKRAQTFIHECAKTAFDTPGEVRAGYDLAATAGAFATLVMNESGNGAAFTTDGTYRGARISVASHVSTVGRQVGEFHHTYSHVVVDVLGLERPFRLSKERVGSKLAKAVGAVKDASTGDEAFDKTFLVAADEEFARDVLDDSIRERLMQLQSKVALVSTDYGTGGMSVLLSNRGLALRWPGDMEPGLASSIRDLLLDMRDRMLAHENRKAVRVGEVAGGYRIASDAAPTAEDAPAAEQDERASRSAG